VSDESKLPPVDGDRPRLTEAIRPEWREGEGQIPTVDQSARVDDEPAPGVPVTARQVTDVLLGLSEEVTACRCRDAAERRVCETLVDTGLYRSAWIGVRSPNDGVAIRATAGEDEPPDAAGSITSGASAEEPPWAAALRTDSLQVVDLGASTGACWPRQDDRSGLTAAVPAGHGDTVNCVLVTHTERGNAFGELEGRALATLGATLGLTVEAVKSRALFFADTSDAIELRIDDPSSLLVRTSRAHNCRLSLESYTARDGQWLLRCELMAAKPEIVAETLSNDPAVEACRTVRQRSDGGLLEIESSDVPLLCRTTALGTTVTSAGAENGTCRVTIEQPPSGDVRETVAGLRTTYPDLEVGSLRDTDRGPTEPGLEGALDGLTDRQREALTVAHDHGYFEWPRRNTAEEIAPELGVTSSTLHWHLRQAQSQIVPMLLDLSDVERRSL